MDDAPNNPESIICYNPMSPSPVRIKQPPETIVGVGMKLHVWDRTIMGMGLFTYNYGDGIIYGILACWDQRWQ